MNTKQLKSSQFPKMLSDLSHSNLFLKKFLLITLCLVLVSSFEIYYFTSKGPIVVALSPEGKVLERTIMPTSEDIVGECISHYMEKRYTWVPSDVQKKLKDSALFVSPTSQKAFGEAIANIIHFSIEKQVSQKVYPAKIEVNMQNRTALITGDRVTSIQGLKAVGNLKLQLTFEIREATKENPWGIYITKEKEE
jgi:hypothetical protein